jgi:hypothetical protein
VGPLKLPSIGRKALVIFAALVALSASTVLVLNVTSVDGTVSGHVYFCVNRPFGSDAAAACNPGKPVSHTGVLFESLSGRGEFLAETDSHGMYSIRLLPGEYRVKYRVVGSAEHNDAGRIYVGDWGIGPISVRVRQQLLLNLTTHALAQ